MQICQDPPKPKNIKKYFKKHTNLTATSSLEKKLLSILHSYIKYYQTESLHGYFSKTKFTKQNHQLLSLLSVYPLSVNFSIHHALLWYKNMCIENQWPPDERLFYIQLQTAGPMQHQWPTQEWIVHLVQPYHTSNRPGRNTQHKTGTVSAAHMYLQTWCTTVQRKTTMQNSTIQTSTFP